MDKTEFVKDLAEFFIEIKKEGVEVTARDVVTLYAIYRKDLRSDRLNSKKTNRNSCTKSNADSGKEPATEKQKQYLMDLAYNKGFCITQTELDRMTREQASKTIDTLLEGD